MKKKKQEKKLIIQLNEFADKFISAIDKLDDQPFDEAQYPTLQKGTDLYKEMEKRAGMKYFEFLVGALKKGDKRKAQRHAGKLRNQLVPTANDYPFERGDRVWVIRTEHAWEPGWLARIDEVHKSNCGRYSYTATVVEGGYDNGHEIYIRHTRDAHRAH